MAFQTLQGVRPNEEDQQIMDLQGNDYSTNPPKKYSYDGKEFSTIEEMVKYKRQQKSPKINEQDKPIEQVNIYKEVQKSNDLSKRTDQELLDLASQTAIDITKNQALRDNAAISYSSKKVQDVAKESSPFYKRYAGTDYIRFNDRKWAELWAEYEANQTIYGTDYAKQKLDAALGEEVASHQGPIEKLYHGFMGMGASAAGDVIAALGMIQGGIDYFVNPEYRKHAEEIGLNKWEAFINRVVDNPTTNYGLDIVKYGALLPKNIEMQKQLGMGAYPIHSTEQQRDQVVSINTIPEALASYGFTVGSMGVGSALSYGNKLFTQGIKTARMAKNASKGYSAVKKSLETANKWHRGKEMLIPGLVGTSEGVIEGLSTKIDAYDEGKQYVDNYFEQYDDQINQYVDNYIVKNAESLNPIIDQMYNAYINQNIGVDNQDMFNEDVIKNIILTQIKTNIKADLKQNVLDMLDYTSSKAGINDFYLNSIVNGIINSSLKLAIYSPATQKVIKDNKLYKKLFEKPAFKTSTDASGHVSVSTTMRETGLPSGLKEVFGEGMEEITQEVGSQVFQDVSMYSIKNYIDDKFNGQSIYEVGDYIKGAFLEGLDAVPEHLLSKDALKAAIMGGLGAAMGGPSVRTFINDNTVMAPNSEGKLISQLSFKPKEGESAWQYIQRLTPWRSGLSQGIKEHKMQYNNAVQKAKELEDWINKSNNKEKILSLIKMTSTGKRLNRAMLDDDEFTYRNSSMAALIDDVMNLKQLEGTEFYDQYIKDIEELSNIQKGSEEARELLQAIKTNSGTRGAFSNTSDTDIIKKVKSNAIEIKTLINQINEEIESLDKMFGNIDPDVKHAMVYGELIKEDWEKREEQLNSEINRAVNKVRGNFIKPTSESEGYTKQELKTLQALDEQKKADFTRKQIDAKIQQLEKSLDSASNKHERKKILKEIKGLEQKRKAQSKILSKSIDNMDSIKEKTLSFQTIMSLPSEIRAIMLNADNLKFFNSEQQEIIKEGMKALLSHDKTIDKKLRDAGRISKQKNDYLKEYIDLLKDPNILNDYLRDRKRDARAAIAIKMAEDLNKIDSYEEFYKAFTEYHNTTDQFSAMLVQASLEDMGNPFIERFSKDIETLNSLLQFLPKSTSFNNLDQNEKDVFVQSVVYLHENLKDILNLEEVSKLFLNNYDTVKQFIEKNNQSKPLNEQVVLNNQGGSLYYTQYKSIIDEYNKYTNMVEERTKPININPETPTNPDPVNIIPGGNVSTSTPSQTYNEPPEDPGNPEEGFDSDSYIDEIIKGLNSLELFKPELLEQYKDYIQELKSLIGKQGVTKEQVDNIAVKHKVSLNWAEYYKSYGQGNQDNPNGYNSKIQTLNLLGLNSDSPVTQMLKNYIETNNMVQFLTNNQLNIKQEFFIISPKALLQNLVKDHPDDLTLQANNIPLVIVVKNGDQWQPVAILPSTGRPQYSGNMLFEEARKKILGQLLDSIQNGIKIEDIQDIQVLGEDNQPIKLLLYNIDYTTIGVHSSVKHDVKNVLYNDLSETDKADYNDPEKNIASKQKKDFLAHVERKSNSDGKIQLIYTKDGANIPILVKPIQETTIEGKSFIELLSENEGIITKNSRVEGFLNTLKETLDSYKEQKVGGEIDTENLENFNTKLNNALRDWIYYTQDTSLNLIKKEGNLITMNLTIADENTEISFSIADNDSLIKGFEQILLNNGNIRTYNDGSNVFNWQVNYINFTEITDDKQAKAANADKNAVYNDNILEVQYSSFKPSVKPLEFQKPITDTPQQSATDVQQQNVSDENTNIDTDTSFNMQDNKELSPSVKQKEILDLFSDEDDSYLGDININSQYSSLGNYGNIEGNNLTEEQLESSNLTKDASALEVEKAKDCNRF